MPFVPTKELKINLGGIFQNDRKQVLKDKSTGKRFLGRSRLGWKKTI